MAKQKGTKDYVAQINSALREHLGLTKGARVPVVYHVLVQKTAQDMRILDRIIDELDYTENLTDFADGSMGQTKLIVSPLLPYYDKMSARVTDDLYNLGLTARKQAQKTEENIKVDKADPLAKMMEAAQKALEE